MILHLLFDDKFCDYAIKHFSEEEMYSEFIIVTHSREVDNTYGLCGVKILKENTEEFHSLLSHLKDYKAIVFHGLFYPWQERVLRAVPDHVKVAWVFWGGDLYSRKDIRNYYLSRASRTLFLIHSLKRFFKGKSTPYKYEVPMVCLKRIDYCLTDIPEDFAFAREYLKTDLKFLWYNYYSVEETLGELVNTNCDGHNILIGNSCTLECNHLDGIRILKRMNPSFENKVYMPLSYGELWLRKMIIRKGYKLLGNSFTPLTSFLPLSKYNEIIKGCAVVIMPHYRPQAFGNILTALWLGSRVFLFERNVLFAYFKKIGTNIYSIEHDLSNTDPNLLTPLSEIEREQNRKVISAIYNKDVMRQSLYKLIMELNQ